MIKTTLKSDGMMCVMCESKGETVIISEAPLDSEKLKEAIAETGYKVLDVKSESHEEKGGLFGIFKK